MSNQISSFRLSRILNKKTLSNKKTTFGSFGQNFFQISNTNTDRPLSSLSIFDDDDDDDDDDDTKDDDQSMIRSMIRSDRAIIKNVLFRKRNAV